MTRHQRQASEQDHPCTDQTSITPEWGFWESLSGPANRSAPGGNLPMRNPLVELRKRPAHKSRMSKDGRSCATVPRQPQDWQKKPPGRALQAQLAPCPPLEMPRLASLHLCPRRPKTAGQGKQGSGRRKISGTENAKWPLSLVMSADGLEEDFGLFDTVQARHCTKERP